MAGTNLLKKAEKPCRCMSALASPLRMAIIIALKDGELSVNDIISKVEGSQSSVSQNLGTMKDRGLVKARREGNMIYYSLVNPKIIKLLDLMEELFCSN